MPQPMHDSPDLRRAMSSMADAAATLLALLDDDQRRAAVFDVADERVRRDWHYVPRQRPGLALGALTTAQRAGAHALLASALRPHAYASVVTIMSLEHVLGQIVERDRRGGPDRDALNYALSVFGEPAADGPWGWRVEGHHVSVNVTVAGGGVAVTPLFLGANPARVDSGGVAVVRPLPAETDAARALLRALSPAERSKAVVSDDAPADILTRAAPRVDALLEPVGVTGADLAEEARELLGRLVAVYTERVPAALAAVPPVEQVAFAWAGSPEAGPHYYRLQGPGILVEYDNTQNGANHVHSVWRDPDRDFGGADPLRRHLREHHAGR